MRPRPPRPARLDLDAKDVMVAKAEVKINVLKCPRPLRPILKFEEESRMGRATCRKCRAPVVRVFLPVAGVVRQVGRGVR
jgi:hypothetical protein